MMFSHSSAAAHVGGGAKGNPGQRNILFCSLDLHIPDAGEPRTYEPSGAAFGLKAGGGGAGRSSSLVMFTGKDKLLPDASAAVSG